jgi:serine/threonine protein kinase
MADPAIFVASANSIPEALPESRSSADEPTSPESVRVFVENYLSPSDDPAYVGRIGRYEVVGIIGSGAMSIVLKEFEKALNRYVAIKVLSPTFSTHTSSSLRFSREARAAAAIVHDNVISIHGISRVERFAIPRDAVRRWRVTAETR